MHKHTEKDRQTDRQKERKIDINNGRQNMKYQEHCKILSGKLNETRGKLCDSKLISDNFVQLQSDHLQIRQDKCD